MPTSATSSVRRRRLVAAGAAMLCGVSVVVPGPAAGSSRPDGLVGAAAPLAASPVFIPRAWTLGREAGSSRSVFFWSPSGGSWSVRVYAVSRVDYATPRSGSRVIYPVVGRPFLLHVTAGVVFPEDTPDVFALSVTLPAGVRTAITAGNPLRCYVTNLNAVPIRRVPATACRQRPTTSGRTVSFTAQRLTRGQAVHFFLPVVSAVVKGGSTDASATVRLSTVLRLKMAVPTTMIATQRLRVRRAG